MPVKPLFHGITDTQKESYLSVDILFYSIKFFDFIILANELILSLKRRFSAFHHQTAEYFWWFFQKPSKRTKRNEIFDPAKFEKNLEFFLSLSNFVSSHRKRSEVIKMMMTIKWSDKCKLVTACCVLFTFRSSPSHKNQRTANENEKNREFMR